MKIVDVTLRDGGFVCDFDWELEFAQQHVQLMEDLDVHIIELGYWKQTAKSAGRFYNMSEETVDKLTQASSEKTSFSVMIDFHYCSKSLSDYPRINQSKIDWIRITSRVEDFDEALKFANQLKLHTGLNISFQIINISNYSKASLDKITAALKTSELDVVGFADSHGNLNYLKDRGKILACLEDLKYHGKQTGLHLHDHTGRAVSNYWQALQDDYDFMDCSVGGLGKGAGNLRMEYIIKNEALPELLQHVLDNNKIFQKLTLIEALNIISGRLGITDNYSKLAFKNSLSPREFWDRGVRISGRDKDSFRSEALKI